MHGDPCRVVLLLWPVAAELLERHPPEQQRILTLHVLLQHGQDVRSIRLVSVPGRREPTFRRVDDAVERDVLCDSEFSHALRTKRAPCVSDAGTAPSDPLGGVAARKAARSGLPSSAIAEAAEEKHDQDDDENPSPDRHRLSSVALARAYRAVDATTLLVSKTRVGRVGRNRRAR
jgi:hypothetical protein